MSIPLVDICFPHAGRAAWRSSHQHVSTGDPSEVSRFSSPFNTRKGHLFFSVISPSKVNHSPLISTSETFEGVHDSILSIDSGRQVGVGHVESVDLAHWMPGSMTAGVTSFSDINAAAGRKTKGAPRRRLAESNEQAHTQPGVLEEEDEVALGDWAYEDGSQLRYLLDGGSGWGGGVRMAIRDTEAGPREVLIGKENRREEE